jgi:hypothetical protein
MTREQGERCGKTYRDAAFSMNDQFRCELPENDGFAAREFVARVFLPGASSMSANALGAFHEAVGERLSSDAPVVDADGVFDK